MEDDLAEKQAFLRENILEKGFDAEDFMKLLQTKKGDIGLDLASWTMDELREAVKEFTKENGDEQNMDTPENMEKIENDDNTPNDEIYDLDKFSKDHPEGSGPKEEYGKCAISEFSDFSNKANIIVLTHMKCLENVGMLSTSPINFEGHEIVPIQFLKALLPDPASLGPRTVGKTNIGCIFTGRKDGKERKIYIYNVCDHQECYKELGSQAISYTTGVPAMIGTALVAKGIWKKPGVFTTDQFDPDPYMEMLNEYGLPWVVDENPVLVE